MPTIIKKGTNPSAFRLKNGKTIKIEVGRGGGEMFNFVSEDDFNSNPNYNEFNDRYLLVYDTEYRLR